MKRKATPALVRAGAAASRATPQLIADPLSPRIAFGVAVPKAQFIWNLKREFFVFFFI